MPIKSPFPGMDPYLEQHWRDVHHRLVTYSCDQLQDHLPEHLRARVEERVFVESAEGIERSVYPDVRVIERDRGGASGAVAAGGTALAEPLVIHVEDEPVSEGYIEIIDAGSGNRVVTVIEFLSLANKLPGEGQNLYLRKQKEILAARVSLVEIDLLRAGRRVLSVQVERIPPSHRTPYQVCVRRGWQTTAAEIYRVPLRQRLPIIRIPLRQTDKDVPLDLQALIDQCYQKGRYDDLDYAAAPNPPLDSADAAWADDLVRVKRPR